MDETRTDVAPVLDPGDVYIYSHGNGAVFVLGSDGRSRLAPLAEALSVADGCHRAGRRVHLAWDDTPLGRQVVEGIDRLDVPYSPFDAPRPPHTWGEGTDALMEAAAVGADLILDDLVARGAEVDARDGSGSTALHHAAARGNLHALEALVAAGAEIDVVNDRGFTPLMLARSTGEDDAARYLASRGADPDGHLESRRFGPSHYGVLHYWVVVPLVFTVGLAAFLWPVSVIDALVVLAVLGVWSRVAPPRAFWAGGVPRRLDGTTLVLRDVLGRRREVDLREVTGAAVGGNPTTSGVFGARWLLLGHPEGHPVDERSLRRLRVPPGEVPGVAGHIARAVVVHVGAGGGDDVVVAIGNVLSGRGVLQSTALRRQLEVARKQRDRGP